MNRLIQLKKRYDKVVELNAINKYATILVTEKKTAQYFRVLLSIKKERLDLISKTTNAESIKQGLANLVLTNNEPI